MVIAVTLFKRAVGTVAMAWLIGRLCLAAVVLGAVAAASPAGGATVQTFSPQGVVASVRQVRATFSEPMVALGDAAAPAPFDVRCTPAVAGTGRWVDASSWVWDAAEDLPPGVRCSATLRPDQRTAAGTAVGGHTDFRFDTGGPAIVRSQPYAGPASQIEEQQVFVLLLNGAATTQSVEAHAHCEAAGIGEQIAVQVVNGADRVAILKAQHLQPQASRTVLLRCARPLPNGAAMTLVWGAGIATPTGVAATQPRRLRYVVRPPFTASFTCERLSSRGDCLPIRPLRVEFSAPVPRRLAERIVLVGPDGRHAPQLEQHRGEDTQQALSVRQGAYAKLLVLIGKSPGTVDGAPSEDGVSAVQFEAPLPENAALRIELPPELQDDAGRQLANAGAFPMHVRTAEAPPLVKFPAATFGILELHAEPTLPVTVRHVEAALQTTRLRVDRGSASPAGGNPAPAAIGRDLVVNSDHAIIGWLAKLERYDRAQLPRRDVERELGIALPPSPAVAAAAVAAASDPASAAALAPGAASSRRLADRTARRYGRPMSPDATDPADVVEARSVGLLDRVPGTQRIALPATAASDVRPFEVVGIPMPTPGFHVVEIASPRLGAALLDRAAPMYVRTSVLVTNLGVHFKHGEVNSAVWVTALDTGLPVADAALRIADCHGQPLWEGRSGPQGFALVDRALPEQRDADCTSRGGTTEDGYFVTARKADADGRADLAFVWSTWTHGIEPWRFNLRGAGDGSDRHGDVYASVLDRTLLRAGQTVSMKHYARRERLAGIGLVPGDTLPLTMRITHLGSGQKVEIDLHWAQGRDADSSYAIPPDAKLGLYQVSLVGEGNEHPTATFRVEAFRLPVLDGRITPPAGVLVQPRTLKLGVEVHYTNGGGAAGLPVQVSAQLRDAVVGAAIHGERYPGYGFEPPRLRAGEQQSPFTPEYVDEDDAGQATTPVDASAGKLVADKLPLALDRRGAGDVTLAGLPALQRPGDLLVQATYADPNGDVQTLSQTLHVWPSSLVLGVRTEQWVSVGRKVGAQLLALDTAGRPVAGARVLLRARVHRTTSVRRRLVGGFYAYDNQATVDELGQVCAGVSDARGLVFCDVALQAAGEVELVAEATDAAGHASQTAQSVWVTRADELWFGGDNQDRMDVVAEQHSYEPGQTARFQVRSPFRQATALVAVERNGILDLRTVALDGRNPTIALPVQADWAPNVYVSVLAVRGRVREVPWYSFFTWGWRAPVDWWHARDDAATDGAGRAATAMVDLSKPAFKYGIAEIEVGGAAHRLRVEVTPEHATYPIRATARVRIQVKLPDGRPAPAGTAVALAAVDEALLSLLPNDTWDLYAALIRRRGYAVDTATAQMQVIGKRHYGKKAAPPGGGGGMAPTRELFDTLLAWRPRVVLDAQGAATVEVPLNDALTAFRIVAVADVVQGDDARWYGTGSATIRSTQDLQLIAGLPPLVRQGDRYRAMFTVRNGTAQAMDAALTADAGTLHLPPQTVHLAAQAAADIGWDVAAPDAPGSIAWTIAADAPAAHDRLKLSQTVEAAVPVRVQQATLLQVRGPQTMPVAAPPAHWPPAAACRAAASRWRCGHAWATACRACATTSPATRGTASNSAPRGARPARRSRLGGGDAPAAAVPGRRRPGQLLSARQRPAQRGQRHAHGLPAFGQRRGGAPAAP